MLTLEDVLEVVEPKRLVASPTGTQVALITAKRRDQVMLLKDPEGIELAQPPQRIVLVDLESGQHRDVTAPLDSATDVAWSPDSNALLVVGNRAGVHGLWRRAIQSAACDLLLEGDISLVQSPGDEVMVVRTDPAVPPDQGDDTVPAGVRVWAFSAGPDEEVIDPTVITLPSRQLIAVDPRTGSTRVVVDDLPGREPVVAPDGKHIALVARQRRISMSSFETANDVDILDGTSGELVARLEGLEQVGYAAMPPAWSPDSATVAVVRRGVVVLLSVDGTARELPIAGEFVACVSDAMNDRAWVVTWHPDGRHVIARTAKGGLYTIAVDTGEPALLGPPAGTGVAELLRDPLAGTTWSPYQDRLVLVSREANAAVRRIWTVGLDGADARLGPETESWLLPNPSSVSKTPPVIVDGAWVHVGHDAAHPFELVTLDQSITPRVLTRLNAGVTVDSTTHHVAWTDTRGRPHAGLLFTPAGYDWTAAGPIPIVVDAYPGGADWCLLSDEWEGSSLLFLKQLLPQRGWGVFVPDMGGVRDSEDTDDLIDPVVSGVDELARRGIADSRVAIIGQSQGGYFVNAIITATDRFAAAVSFSGMCNISSEFGLLWPTKSGPSMHGTANAEGYCGGPPWEVPEAYIARSPVFHLHKVSTPLMLVHGTDDTGAGVSQAGEMYVGLRRLSKPVKVLMYRGEWHGPNSFSEPNRTHMVSTVLDFLEQHLTPRPT